MADIERTRARHDRRKHRWIWALLGIVAVGLVVFWVAAGLEDEDDVGVGLDEDEFAVDRDEVRTEEEMQAAVDRAEDELAEQEVVEEPVLGERGPEVVGRAPEKPRVDDISAVEQFSAWSEYATKPVDVGYVAEGLASLDDAVAELLRRDPGAQAQRGADQPVGGGPAGDFDSDQIRHYHQRLIEATERLERASGQEQAAIFEDAANNVTMLLSEMQREAGLEDLAEPVDQLEATSRTIESRQPLDQQEDTVRQFFQQSASVLDRMSRALEERATGGGPLPQEGGAMD